jgi:hypothetical protein
LHYSSHLARQPVWQLQGGVHCRFLMHSPWTALSNLSNTSTTHEDSLIVGTSLRKLHASGSTHAALRMIQVTHANGAMRAAPMDASHSYPRLYLVVQPPARRHASSYPLLNPPPTTLCNRPQLAYTSMLSKRVAVPCMGSGVPDVSDRVEARTCGTTLNPASIRTLV